MVKLQSMCANGYLHSGTVLVQRQQLSCSEGIERAMEEQARRRSVALKHLHDRLASLLNPNTSTANKMSEMIRDNY